MSDPVLVSIAAGLASRVAVGLFQLVKEKFADNADATVALEASERAAEDSQEVAELTRHLEIAEQDDPEFGKRLRAEWAAVRLHAETGGVINQISGTVHGKVVQARDIQGGVSF